MTTIQVSQLRSDLSNVANKVAYTGERICVERNHKPLLALVPLDDMQLLEHLEDKMDIELAKEALKRGEFIDWKDVKKELGLIGVGNSGTVKEDIHS